MRETVLVTGATGGIGSALVRLLIDQGYGVVGWDIQLQEPDAVLFEGANYTLVDHTDSQAVAEAASRLPGLDHAVLLAGRALPIEAQYEATDELPSADEFEASVLLNLCGHYNVIRALTPLLMVSTASSSITLASSINAREGFGLPAYASAKAGLSGLVVALAGRLGRRGIRINAVELGTVHTSASEREWAHASEHFQSLEAGSALGRLTTVEEAARSYLVMIRDLTSVTGTSLLVDAGQSVVRG